MISKRIRNGVAVLSLMTTLVVPAVAQTGAAPQSDKARQAGVLTADLFLAIFHDSPAEAHSALTRGADANGKNWLGLTPLMWAAMRGNPKIVEDLLAHKAQVETPGNYGTALSFALLGRQDSMALSLLEKGASVHGERTDGATPLLIAAGNGQPQVVKALLAHKADANETDTDGANAVYYAARRGRAEAMRLLIQAHGDVNRADSHGRTPLMAAAENGHTACVDLLLANGARVDAQDSVGATALTLAARHSGVPGVVRNLVRAGADKTHKDGNGASAFALADQRGYSEAAKLLQAPGLTTTALTRVSLTAAQTRPAIQRSLTAIQTGMKSFAERAQCNSCHHQGLGMIVLGTAQQRGFLVDKEVVGSYLKQVGEDGQRNGPVIHEALTHPDTAKTIPAVDIGDISIGTGYIFGGLIANGVPGNPGLQEMAQFLAAQQPDGHWSYGMTREPMQDSLITTTALVTQVMRVYGETDKPGPTADSLRRAKQWFLTCPATTAEDKAARLLGLVWAGATAGERKRSVQELLATQRPDGGWAIESASGSDAYATGMALYALHVGGNLSANAPAYRRGARFLLRTQDEDGTWYLNKRANPANTYFDAGFPNGVSQYASFAATCWATLALMQTDAPTQQAQR